MDVKVTAREQIPSIMRGVHRLVPEGRDDSSPAPKAFGAGLLSLIPPGSIHPHSSELSAIKPNMGGCKGYAGQFWFLSQR
jgi:hypothetical protein